MAGIVYVLTNEGMPELVKFGKTINLKQRVETLYSTGVPYPFDVYHAVVVDNPQEVEEGLREVFSTERINPKREFYKVHPSRVAAALNLTGGRPAKLNEVVDSGEGEIEELESSGGTEITDADREARDRQVRRRAYFNFAQAQIPVDAHLTFTLDSSKTAKVAEDHKKVIFEGKKMSLSASAGLILCRDLGWNSTVSGPDYWEYDGEILNIRLKRLEEEFRQQKEEDAEQDGE